MPKNPIPMEVEMSSATQTYMMGKCQEVKAQLDAKAQSLMLSLMGGAFSQVFMAGYQRCLIDHNLITVPEPDPEVEDATDVKP